MKGELSQREIKILNGTENHISVYFDSFFSYNANFQYNNATFEIVSKGFGGKSFQVLRSKKEIGSIEISWKLTTTIKLENEEQMTKMYYLASGSFFDTNYYLTDNFDHQLYVFSKKWDWSRFGFTFELKDGNGLAEAEPNIDQTILKVLTLFCCKVLNSKKAKRRSA